MGKHAPAAEREKNIRFAYKETLQGEKEKREKTVTDLQRCV